MCHVCCQMCGIVNNIRKKLRYNVSEMCVKVIQVIWNWLHIQRQQQRLYNARFIETNSNKATKMLIKVHLELINVAIQQIKMMIKSPSFVCGKTPKKFVFALYLYKYNRSWLIIRIGKSLLSHTTRLCVTSCTLVWETSHTTNTINFNLSHLCRNCKIFFKIASFSQLTPITASCTQNKPI